MSIFSNIAHDVEHAAQQAAQGGQSGLDGHVLAQPTVVQQSDPDVLTTLKAAAGQPQADHYTVQYGILGGTPPIAIYDGQGHIFIPSQDESKTLGTLAGAVSGPVHDAGIGAPRSATQDHVETHPGDTGIAPLVHTEVDPTTGKIIVTDGSTGADPVPAIHRSSEGDTHPEQNGSSPVILKEVDPTGRAIVKELPTGADPLPSSTQEAGSGHKSGFWDQAAQSVDHHSDATAGKGLASALGSVLQAMSHMDHGHGLSEALHELSSSGLPHWAEMAEQHAGLGGHGGHAHVAGDLAPAHADDGAHFAHTAGHFDLHHGHGHV